LIASKLSRCIFFLLLIISPFFTFAQSATIKGVVHDSLNKVFPDVTVGVLGKPIGTTTDEKGQYTLQVPSGETIKIVFTSLGFTADTSIVNLKSGETKTVNKSLHGKVFEMHGVDIEGGSLKKINITPINPKNVSSIPTPNQSVEDLLKTMPGVSSANELSSTYSVRGGNYDENLVYINDFEVYRPLLVRSGQQEGLSIINPDMVDDIRFSAGGFDAVYGDKMSSVLDIQYRKPKKFGGSINLSALGGSIELENRSKNSKWYYMIGARQKSTQYLLNTFETKGEYRPSFTDGQFLAGFQPNKKFNVEIFANYAYNRYQVVPTDRETNFGTINDAKRLTVYFEGQEIDRYQTMTGAVSTTYHPNDKVKLKLIASGYNTQEHENFDILGQYYLDQLETDLGKATFGQVAFNLGVGSFLNHARNSLDGDVFSLEHKGEVDENKTIWQWGVKAEHEYFDSKLHEWYYNDSSGYSIPSSRDSANPAISLNDVVISSATLSSNHYSGYFENILDLSDSSQLVLTSGVRANYSDLNSQLVISPRVSLKYTPKNHKNLSYRLAGGFYYQPPFYRELIGIDGTVYPNTKAQQSIQVVFGSDYTFLALGREFKLTSEIYYKFLDNIIPYEVDNLRIRYLPNYSATGYARGLDFRLFGDFVPGVESWASISFLQTYENIKGDYYYTRYNAEGEEIIKGFTFDQNATDSVKTEPGYIPRPTDQRVNFGLFFQDYLPKFPTYKMQLSLLFGTGLPFGPPGADRYQDVLRTPQYKRVDIGFSKQLIGDEVKRKPHSKFFGGFESLSIGLEVFNLLQVSNVASYTWITDVTNARQYAVPNYLTGRQLNIRLNAKF